MKPIILLLAMLTAGAMGRPLTASETDQLKFDLVGQTMGGREKSWKFQSAEQIKSLEIKNKTEDPQQRTYAIALKLQASSTTKDTYAAQARVRYAKSGTGWKLTHVGLVSLKKLQ